MSPARISVMSLDATVHLRLLRGSSLLSLPEVRQLLSGEAVLSEGLWSQLGVPPALRPGRTPAPDDLSRAPITMDSWITLSSSADPAFSAAQAQEGQIARLLSIIAAGRALLRLSKTRPARTPEQITALWRQSRPWQDALADLDATLNITGQLLGLLGTPTRDHLLAQSMVGRLRRPTHRKTRSSPQTSQEEQADLIMLGGLGELSLSCTRVPRTLPLQPALNERPGLGDLEDWLLGTSSPLPLLRDLQTLTDTLGPPARTPGRAWEEPSAAVVAALHSLPLSQMASHDSHALSRLSTALSLARRGWRPPMESLEGDLAPNALRIVRRLIRDLQREDPTRHRPEEHDWEDHLTEIEAALMRLR